jgi:hypothetical protein
VGAILGCLFLVRITVQEPDTKMLEEQALSV